MKYKILYKVSLLKSLKPYKHIEEYAWERSIIIGVMVTVMAARLVVFVFLIFADMDPSMILILVSLHRR